MKNACWKRLFAVILTLMLIASLMPAAFASDASGESSDGEPPVDAAPACTCGAAEDAAHAEGCPLYVAPEPEPEDTSGESGDGEPPVDTALTCTCDADEGNAHTAGCPLYVAPEPEPEDAVSKVQAMINALPKASMVTEENADEVKAQLEAIDAAKLSLTDEQMDALDIQKYMAVAAALGAVYDAMTLDEVVVAKIGNQTYETLAAAVEAASAGDTITLLTDVELTAQLNISKNIILDLSNCTIQDTNSKWGLVVTDKVTIKNGTIASKSYAGVCIISGGNVLTQSLTIDTSSSSSTTGVYMQGGTFTLSADSTIKSGEAGIFILNEGTTANIYGIVQGVGDYPAVMGNGSPGYGGTVINIYDGATIKANGIAMYLPQSGTVNISGGTVEGYAGIGIKSGTLNITGGTIKGTANDTSLSDANSATNGIAYDGSAIVIDSYVGYAGDVNITISGNALVESTYSTAIHEIGNTSGQTNVVTLEIEGGTIVGGTGMDAVLVRKETADTVSISGGTFSSDVSEYVVAGNKAIAKGDGTYYIGVDTSKAVAEVNGYGYTTVDAAIKEVENGGTVKLLKDAADITIPEGYTVTLDLNGCTVSSASDHAITNNGSLTVTGTGTVDGGSTSGKGALYNTGTATLNSGTFTTDSWYVIKNVGDLTINGATVTSNDQNSSAIANGYYSSSETGYGKVANLTINSGAVASNGLYTLKNDDYGVMTINGGTFSNSRDNSGVVLNAGESLTITDGTFEYTGANGSVIQEYRCSETINAAVLTISGGNFKATQESATVLGSSFNTVSGGTVTITDGTFIGNLEQEPNNETISVSGGTFSVKVPEIYCAAGYAPTDMDANGNYTVCSHSNVTAVAAQAATCGKAGNIAYWYCADCGRYFSDSSYIQEVAKTDLVIPATGKHTYDGYSCDSTGHWQVCTVCGAVTDVQAHSFASTVCDDNVTRQICTVCGSAKLSLSYDPNGGRRAPAAQAVITSPDSYSGIIVISAAKPSRFGYFFQGWSTSTSGNVQYRPGDSITITQDTTLYAVWARPTDSPRTGDTSNLGLWIAVAGVSVLAIGAAAFIIFKKKGGNK